jgi:hypothetical protein
MFDECHKSWSLDFQGLEKIILIKQVEQKWTQFILWDMFGVVKAIEFQLIDILQHETALFKWWHRTSIGMVGSPLFICCWTGIIVFRLRVFWFYYGYGGCISEFPLRASRRWCWFLNPIIHVAACLVILKYLFIVFIFLYFIDLVRKNLVYTPN